MVSSLSGPVKFIDAGFANESVRQSRKKNNRTSYNGMLVPSRYLWIRLDFCQEKAVSIERSARGVIGRSGKKIALFFPRPFPWYPVHLTCNSLSYFYKPASTTSTNRTQAAITVVTLEPGPLDPPKRVNSEWDRVYPISCSVLSLYALLFYNRLCFMYEGIKEVGGLH